MKKLLAIFLAAIMVLTIVPFSAFAKVEINDKLMNELMNGTFHHVSYVKEKKYFSSAIGWYTLLGLYDDAWNNFFTGKVDQNNAQSVLLGLIDRMEEEYNNETYEKILAILSTAKTGAELVEKLGSVSGLFNLADNAAWSKSLGVAGTVLQGLNLGNEIYEKFVQGYAVILSCQAASIYYGDFLDYVAENCDDKDIKKAASDLKETLVKSLEDAVNDLLAKLASESGEGVIEIVVNIALSSFSVTAIAKTVFGIVGSLGDAIFNTKEQFLYMSSLAIITKIEETIPNYVANELKGGDELSSSFAVNALLTLHEIGEDMLTNLSQVKDNVNNSTIGRLFSGSADESALIRECSIEKAKLNVYRMIINADDTYKTYDVFTSTDTTKKAVVYDANGYALVTLPANAEKSILNETGAYATVYDSTISTYIKVMVTFSEGCEVVYKNPTTSGSSSSSSSSGGGIGGFFSSLFQAFADLFKALFSFGKN